MCKNVYLLRGIPGSGKSTLATALMKLPDSVAISTDDYFIRDGKYKFDRAKLSEYHQRNQVMFHSLCSVGKHNIIVHNTFVRKWELEPYIGIAKRFDYQIHIMTVESRRGEENVHGVPIDTVRLMKNHFQFINCGE